jgi:tripartite-type tricarboxylate transporter receptor subunit TctC
MKRLLAGLALLLAAASPAWAEYPERPIRMVVPFPPGGVTDVVARLMAEKLTADLGQQVIVDNKAGAGSVIGTDIVAKAPADGYTLLMTSGSIVTANPYIFRKLPYSPEKDLVAVTNVASGPQVIVVNPSFAAKTLKDFIAVAKAKPRSFSY